MRDAFDVDKEPTQVRERYGEGPLTPAFIPANIARSASPDRSRSFGGDCCFTTGGGTRIATTSPRCASWCPRSDQALTALITDLDERGLLEDVVVVMGGEFGRTPRIGDITPDGRSHWPEAGFLWLAGGGLKTGQVIGGTDARGEHASVSPSKCKTCGQRSIRYWESIPASRFETTTADRNICSKTERP